MGRLTSSRPQRDTMMMNVGLRSRIAAVAVVAAVLMVTRVQSQIPDAMRRQRETFARGFDLAREHPRLAGYVRLLSRALGGPAAFRHSTVRTAPTTSTERERMLQAATELVTSRFRLAPDGVTSVFARIARPHAGRIVMRGQTAYVEVSDRHRDNDDLIMAVVAHEFAHAALERGLAGTADEPLAEDESLVDAAAVMVGFGPMMLRASYDQTIKGTGDRQYWEVVRIGELDPVAIAYLTLVQAELSGADEESRRAFVGQWIEPVWAFRTTQWRAVRPRMGTRGYEITCPTCLSVAPVLPDGVTYACPVCGLHARFGATPPRSRP